MMTVTSKIYTHQGIVSGLIAMELKAFGDLWRNIPQLLMIQTTRR